MSNCTCLSEIDNARYAAKSADNLINFWLMIFFLYMVAFVFEGLQFNQRMKALEARLPPVTPAIIL